MNPDGSWEDALRRGGSWKARPISRIGSPPPEIAGGSSGSLPEPRPGNIAAGRRSGRAVALAFGHALRRPGSNRGWLQENPEPVSTITWGNWMDIHPGKAKALGSEPGMSLNLPDRGQPRAGSGARARYRTRSRRIRWRSAWARGIPALGMDRCRISARTVLP